MVENDAEPQHGGVTALAIFVAYSRISLTSWGGPLFWARRELVERQHWLTDEEFTELLALGQVLPGPNVFNLMAMASYRFAGLPGVAAGIAGFMVWPFFMIIGLGMLQQRYAALPLVQNAFAGMSAVAAGLLLASGVRMAAALPRHWRRWLLAALAFAGVGILRWPLLAVLALLAPYAIVKAWKEKD